MPKNVDLGERFTEGMIAVIIVLIVTVMVASATNFSVLGLVIANLLGAVMLSVVILYMTGRF